MSDDRLFNDNISVNLLVVSDDPAYTYFYPHIAKHFPEELTVTMLETDRAYTDALADRLFNGPEDVILLFDRGIMFHLARTGPHPKPIIVYNYYGALGEYERLVAGGLSVARYNSIEEICSLIETAVQKAK